MGACLCARKVIDSDNFGWVDGFRSGRVGHRDIVWPGLDSVGRDASGGRGDVDDVVNYRGASGSRALSLIARRVFNPEKL